MRAGNLLKWLLRLMLLTLHLGAAEAVLRPPQNTDQSGALIVPGICESFRPPKIDGLIWGGVQSQIQSINGRTSAQTILRFHVTKAGTYQMPELSIPIQSGAAHLDAQAFTVSAGEMLQSLRLRLLFGPEKLEKMPELFVGEDIDISLEVLIRDDYEIMQNLSAPDLALPGLSLRPEPKQKQDLAGWNSFRVEENVLLEKRLWTRLVLQGRIKAVLPGKHEGGASAKILVRPRGGFLDQPHEVSASVASGSYQIKNLPPLPAGVEFLNLVGSDYSLGLALAPSTEIKSSDSCQLILSIRGGDLSSLKLPDWRFPGFQNLTPLGESKNGDSTWTLIPDGGGVSLPEIAVATFDPRKAEYQIKRFTPQLKVSGPPPVKMATKVSPSPQLKPLPILSAELVSAPPPSLPTSLLLFILGPLLLIGLQWRPGKFWQRLKNRRQRAHLAERLEAGDEQAVAALEAFLRSLWQVPPGADLATEAERRGSRDFGDALRASIEARFAPQPAASLPALGKSLRLLPLLLLLVSSLPLFAATETDDPGRAAYGRAVKAWDSDDAAGALAELDYAQELVPRSIEIASAVEQARSAVGPKASAPGAIVQLRDQVSPGEWLRFAALIWLTACLLAAVLMRRGRPWRAILAAGLICTLLPLSFALAQSAGSRASGRAVAAVELKPSGSPEGKAQGSGIAAGSLVLIRQSSADGSWVEVSEIHGAGQGWIKAAELRRAAGFY